METFLHSLEFAALITGGVALFLCVAVIPRLHTVWKGRRGVSVTMPFQDIEELRFRVTEALKFLGTPTPSAADGFFTIEPSNWRKKFGTRPVTIVLVQPQLALVTSQGFALNGLAKKHKLPLVYDPNNTFGMFLQKQTKWFSWTMASAFVIIFTLFMVNDPQGGDRRAGTKAAPVQQSSAARNSR